ncbi:Mkln1 [Symbiodinium natans]|uniref:Mkln1 protein n=1 Tax=Symbiodinium natans TaxID=878477 RepID=A0A812S383_9DINO|nr:Mkln1 [Symbiodinium natans]
MAYDFIGQALWLHGGEGKSDFWRYDIESSTWTQQILASEPTSTNGGHAMVFDEQRHALWLYGGKGSLTNGEKLWKFDIANMTWSEQTHALNKPVGRKNHAMVYDFHEQMLWMFGGRMSNGNYVLENTCRYDIQTSTWRTWALDPEPPKRYSHAMAYDSESRAVWLHGGEHTAKFDDLWKLDVQTKTWSEQTPGLPKPSARRNAVIIYDPIGHRLWLHGGLTDGGRIDDLWRYDIQMVSWTEETVLTSKPMARYSHVCVYDFMRQDLWLHGGWAGPYQSRQDFWKFTVPAPNTTTTLGSASSVSATTTTSSSATISGTILTSTTFTSTATLTPVAMALGTATSSTTLSTTSTATVTATATATRSSISSTTSSTWTTWNVSVTFTSAVAAGDSRSPGHHTSITSLTRSTTTQSSTRSSQTQTSTSLAPHVILGDNTAKVPLEQGTASLVASLSCAAALAIMVLAWKARKMRKINGRVTPEADGQYSLTDPLDFIRYLREADVRLVRLSYLLELQQKRRPWPRRQEAESVVLDSGETALVAASELNHLAHPDKGRRFFTACGKLIHFGSVSHCWESMQHPDPWKFQLDQTISRFHHMEGDRSQVWLFIDFMSLFQYPRSEAQNQSFLKALQGMHVLYAHELVKVEVLDELTPMDVQSAQKDCLVAVYNDANKRVEEIPAAALKLNHVPYDQRGWCQAEQEWASLRETFAKRVPMPPNLFSNCMDSCRFTHRNDSALVKELQEKIFLQKAQETTKLNLQLPDDQVPVLCAALPYFGNLDVVIIRDTKLGCEGARRIVESGSRHIHLDACQLGDEEALAIADALETTTGVDQLTLRHTQISSLGVEALRAATKIFGAVCINLDEQKISGGVAQSVGPTSSMETTDTLRNASFVSVETPPSPPPRFPILLRASRWTKHLSPSPALR